MKSSLEGSVKATRKVCIATGIMLLHKLANTDAHQKLLEFYEKILTHLPRFRQCSVLSCRWGFFVFLVFLIGILYSLPVAAIYVLKDNFSVNESKLQESPGAEISVARTSFSQQPAKTIH